jgi:hypothetical protein
MFDGTDGGFSLNGGQPVPDRNGGGLIWLIDKFDYALSYNSTNAQTIDIPLTKYIDTVGWRSGGLASLVHSRSVTWTTGLTLSLFLRNTICTPSDPATWFDAGGTGETSLTVVRDSTVAPTYLVTALSAPIGPQLRAFVRIVPPTTGASSGACSISVAVWGRTA